MLWRHLSPASRVRAALLCGQGGKLRGSSSAHEKLFESSDTDRDRPMDAVSCVTIRIFQELPRGERPGCARTVNERILSRRTEKLPQAVCAMRYCIL